MLIVHPTIYRVSDVGGSLDAVCLWHLLLEEQLASYIAMQSEEQTIELIYRLLSEITISKEGKVMSCLLHHNVS